MHSFEVMNGLVLVSSLVCLLSVSGLAGVEIDTGKPTAVVEAVLREYYAGKYPVYAELQDSAVREGLHPTERLRKVGELHKRSPVSEVVNSFPHGPFHVFVERTRTPEGKKAATRIDLHAKSDGTCRIVMKTKASAEQAGFAFAAADPVTAEDIRKLLR